MKTVDPTPIGAGKTVGDIPVGGGAACYEKLAPKKNPLHYCLEDE